MKDYILAFAFILGILGFCCFIGIMAERDSVPAPVHSDYVAGPGVIMEVLDPSLEPYAVAWQREVARRFPSAVAILAHGGDLEQGRWIIQADGKHLQTADDIAAKYRALYPGRVIVLLSCNPGHIKLHVPGVYHFHASVWCVPDRATGKNDIAEFMDLDGGHPHDDAPRWESCPEDEGNIFEATVD